MSTTLRNRAVKTSAWSLYTLIVLEILFMVSPFAAYYYSIYATPLNALQQSRYTGWLTMYILPHFTYSDSWLTNGLILVSWPLILLGIVLFVLGFCQIYWSKFTSKGAVEVGLYRSIRHPQYVALAIIGLGTSLYWSRFIVVIAFVGMLCIYYFLARMEESVCLDKFGEPYRNYMDRTGMFLPRGWEKRWRSLGFNLPQRSWRRVALCGLVALVLISTTGIAHLLRGHAINSLQIEDSQEHVTIFLAPVSENVRESILELLDDNSLPGKIAYVAPSSWRVPELGFDSTTTGPRGGSFDELLHPTLHGNSLKFDKQHFSVLLADAKTAAGNIQGVERFTRALNIKPIEFAELDLAAGRIIDRKQAAQGAWAGIPVPTF